MDYLIGVVGRKEISASGGYNPSYNLVDTASQMAEACNIANRLHRTPAFVTIALRPQEGLYSAYFGLLEAIDYKNSVPMHPDNPDGRKAYELLMPPCNDARVAALG